MTVTAKDKIPLVVPHSVRRRAGIKNGDRLQFRVSGGVITIVPKLAPDELEDYMELRDPAVQRQIRASNADIRAGRTQPAAELLAELRKGIDKPRKRRRTA